MRRTDYITKAPPWTVAEIARDVGRSLDKLASAGIIGRNEIDKLQYEAMSGRLCDIEKLVDVRKYLG